MMKRPPSQIGCQCFPRKFRLLRGVKRLSVSELNELLEEVETAIKEYSEELVQQLALRDELEFEKEVKNSFISILIEVQNKQKEHKETAKKKKKLKNGSSQNGKNERSHMPGTYLTTVIPYEKKNGPPSVEDLQILTKILRAMKEDSEKVPSLLTDYILKGEMERDGFYPKESVIFLVHKVLAPARPILLTKH
uniref:Fasciculation and elongation protein zeta 2 n=1 Tax=Sus scrofa TaxID=9823 RepID=A0A8D0XLY7_PIG